MSLDVSGSVYIMPLEVSGSVYIMPLDASGSVKNKEISSIDKNK
jgi:hypothetical protein